MRSCTERRASRPRKTHGCRKGRGQGAAQQTQADAGRRQAKENEAERKADEAERLGEEAQRRAEEVRRGSLRTAGLQKLGKGVDDQSGQAKDANTKTDK